MLFHPPRIPTALLALVLLSAAILTLRQSHAQIYADFDTSMGGFTIELYYEDTPTTVANFIALAEGSQVWIDLETGLIKENQPFYNGTIFHRVIKDFMIQGGSPNGTGTDGPGYTILDEFPMNGNGLRHPHGQQGLISMANSGVNTNGGQFFITDVPTPWLDGKHTVFGKIAAGPHGTLAEGLTVITAMNNTETTGSVPNTPLLINTISVRRVGAAANAFNIADQKLPRITRKPGTVVVGPGNSSIEVEYPRKAHHDYLLASSPDLRNWILAAQTYSVIDATEQDNILPGLPPPSRSFFQLADVEYIQRGPVEVPHTMAGGEIELTFDSFFTPLIFHVGEDGHSGTWEERDGDLSGEIATMTYFARPLSKAQAVIQIDGLVNFRLILHAVRMEFLTATTGTYSTSTNAFANGTPVTLSGTFVLTPPG